MVLKIIILIILLNAVQNHWSLLILAINYCYCMVNVVRMITTLNIVHNGYTRYSLVSLAIPFAPAEEGSVWSISLEGVIQVECINTK